MSRYCAKPTCSEFVHSWFEMSREGQRVAKRSTSTKHAIGLCESHAGRFKVPAGWTFDNGEHGAETEGKIRSTEIGTVTPWFLSENVASPENATSPTDDSPAGPDDSVSKLDNTEKGTMLDRAFHGPGKREATQNSASTQAKPSASVAQNPSGSNESDEEQSVPDNTGEIPFPPHGLPVATI